MNLKKIAILTSVVLVTGLTSLAAEKKATKREHPAHQHGSAKMDIAFEGPNGQINFQAATEGIYGFEYAPRTEEDQKKQHESLAIFETNFVDMVAFDKTLKCEVSKQKLEVVQEAGTAHSDLKAEFKVICEKSPVGSKITFNIQKSFPKLKDVDIQVIADDLQKSFEAKKNGAQLNLKK